MAWCLIKNKDNFTFQNTEPAKSVESSSREKLEAGSWGQGEFGNPEEGERPTLEAATK
jgi:hypothetical protein